jgi:hypothetical protein
VTWIVLPEPPTVPPLQSVLVKPGSVPVVDGGDQPEGRATVSSPELRTVVDV